MARLGDVCIQITDGSHNPPMGIEKSNHLMLSSKNIDDDRITFNDPRYLSQQDFEAENKRTNIEPGDLLMTIVGTIGRVAIVPDNLTGICVQRSVAVLKPKPETVYNRFLMYYLQNMCPYLEQESRGVAQKGIYLKQLNNLTVILPPLDEQREIAAVLDKVSDLIAKRRQQLDRLDELVKSRFIEMFGDPVQNPLRWTKRPLLEMGYCKNGINFHTGDSGIEMYCLGVGDFKDHSVIDGTDCLPTVSLNEAPPEESMLRDGDIVFVRSNGNKALVGRCLVVYPHSTPTTYSGFCIRYRLTSDDVNTAYLLRVLKTDSMRKMMAGRGANIQNLNQQILATLNVPIPPKELQEQFASFVAQTDKSKLAVQQGLQELEILKKSLMQEYFE